MRTTIFAFASLSLSCLALPYNDSIENAADLGSQPRLHRMADPRLGTLEDFEFSLEPSDPFFPHFFRSGSLWYRWQAPQDGTYHVAGTDGGDLVDVYDSTPEGLGSVLAYDEDQIAIPIHAVAGQEFFIRLTSITLPATDPFGFPMPLAEPSGFILRHEGTGHVTDLGPRSGFAAYLSSFGPGNAESYTWTAAGTGEHQLLLHSFSGDPSATISLDVNSTPIDDPADFMTLPLSAGDQVTLTLTGSHGFVNAVLLPPNPASSDLGSVGEAVIPSTDFSLGFPGEWSWTAPEDGFVRIDLETSYQSWLSFFHLASFSGQFVTLSARDTDCLTLAYRGCILAPVQKGESYSFAEYGDSPESVASGCITLKFTSHPTSLDELVDAATIALEADPADPTTADLHLAAALAIDPDDPRANALRAFTRLALLQEEPSFAAFLQSLGITDSGGASLGLRLTMTEALDGRPEFPASANASERVAALRDLVSPRLDEIHDYLNAAVAEADRLLPIASFKQSYVIDDADLLAMKGSVRIVQALLDLLSIYDLGGAMNAIVEFEREGQLDLEVALEELPTLLEVAKSSAIEDFKSHISEANTLLCAALVLAGGERTLCGYHLFPLVSDADEGEAFVEYFEGLEELAKALEAPVDIDGVTLDLTAWNSSTPGLRGLLPKFSGNRPLGFTAGDPTMGGVLPGNDQGGIARILEDSGILAEPAGFSFWIQTYLSESLPPGLEGFLDDMDGDGYQNGEEYYFASNPADPSIRVQSPIAALDSSQAGSGLQVSFVRRIGGSDIRYLVAVSSDLENWDYSEAKVTVLGSPMPVGDGEGEVVTVSIEADGLGKGQYVRIHAVAR
ncbi:hypothetical protein ACFQY0_01405 [Haloferula chungangensis]|uniref:Uncharacterized protein n=1 Tax=Haloferula chungangensis TaxID=1048331 RepID=A0ABW2L0I2_9BACT